MKHRLHHDSNDDLEDLGELKQLYQAQHNEMPSVELDRQIIAAAHRELAKPNRRELPQHPWWKRIVLPLYATATLVFTVFAAHILWPEPVRVPPGTTMGPVNIELIQSKKVAPQVTLKPREKRELPPYKAPEFGVETASGDATLLTGEISPNIAEETPDRAANTSDSAAISHATAESGSVNQESKLMQPNQVAKLSFPDQERWARDIIKLFRDGEYEQAREQLVRFKKVYPQYPIDEQIDALR